MSSLDGVGRYFPLTLFACADDDAAIPPPELDSQDDWFDAAEGFLLSTLDQDANFEEITARIDKWSPPHQEFPRRKPRANRCRWHRGPGFQ